MVVAQLGPGQSLGRYELLLPIAKGGMAQVWAARLCGTRGFQKIVAIKTILSEGLESQRVEQMFLEEARLAAQIRHPNVADTLELGEESGTLYLVMEWVHGEPLRALQEAAQPHGGIPKAVSINIIGQACKGLDAAHEARGHEGELLGIVHRDISPQNVLVSYSGTVKLVDFGIAKATTSSTELTQQGELKGKLAYMSPEQLLERPVDRRSDIFSMGVLLYSLTTGRHPFRAEAAVQTLQNICSLPAIPPSRFSRGYPAGLERVVLKALAKNPDERWATAQEMLEALIAAEPEALRGSYESRVSSYVHQLLGNAAQERLETLAKSQRWVDQLHGEEPLSARHRRDPSVQDASPSSREAKSYRPAPPPHSERAFTLIGAAGDKPTGTTASSRYATLRPWLLATGLVGLGVAFALFGSRASIAPAGQSQLQAGAPLTNTLAAQLKPVPSTHHSREAASQAAAEIAASAPEPAHRDQAAETSTSKPRPKESPQHPRRRNPLSTPPEQAHAVSVAKPDTDPTPPKPASPSPITPKQRSVNAWDAANYGGRN